MYREWGEKECIKDMGGTGRRKEPLGRPSRRWVGNIKMDLRELGVTWTALNWLRIGTSGGLLCIF
jgi:hypothetical protein